MIFEETPPRLALAILGPLLALLLAFPLWHVAERDLFWDEGCFAQASQEMQTFPPVMTAHGQVIKDEYPLFPLLVKVVHKTGASIEFSLRFVSLSALAAIAIMIWITCYRMVGLQAAAAATAMMISTILVGEKTLEGYPQMLTVCLVFAGWLLWFDFGQARGRWHLAWIWVGIFSGLAFYSGGWQALCYLLVPLAFQRRPISPWPRIKRWGFFVAAFCVLSSILFWWIPYWVHGISAGMELGKLSNFFLHFSFWDYLINFVTFPLDVLLRFMPWTLMIWAPFCPALIPLDKNPLFAKYLRIMTYVMFLLLLLNPMTRGRDILFLAPPLSILVGLNYWIVVRRYGDRFLMLFQLMGYLLILTSAGLLAYIMMPQEMIQSLPWIPARLLPYRVDNIYRLFSGSELGLSLILGVLGVILCRNRRKVWVTWLVLFCSSMLVFWAVVNPFRAQDRSRSELGKLMRNAIGDRYTPEMVIYKDTDLTGLYSETFYMGIPIRTINDKNYQSDDEQTVYLITAKAPVMADRYWSRLLSTVYKDQRLYLWEGELKEEDESTNDE